MKKRKSFMKFAIDNSSEDACQIVVLRLTGGLALLMQHGYAARAALLRGSVNERNGNVPLLLLT